ncbi:MAG: Rne/Rng family ribonuclease [Phycisphaerae bacterium]
MLINVAEGEECRIAILHQGRLEELFMERASTGSHVGNIYKGRVTNVEPSIQAAFIDFGLPKNGFLHISDLQPQYFPEGMKQIEEVGRKTPRRDRPPIQKCLRRGQEVLVQIIKEGIGTKGPTLTTYISIPGRFLVMLPGMERLGVSRKIEDDESRRAMRRILDELDLPKDMGFILRTAGMDRSKRELQRDLQYLNRLWKVVAARIKNERAPCELYQESDLVIRTVRDVYSPDFGKIIVDDEAVAEKIRDFLSIIMPRGSAPVEVFKGPEPLFHHYKIEEEIERINARHVPLPSGGSLVIDSTEALVAIDVNSGRYREHDDAEETAYRINLEAAEEIARQLRLRDLGGLVVCDFIDMRMEKHRRGIERALRDALKKHKERAKCLRMSQFGIIEMTRQRMRPSIKRSIYQDCPHCRGSGLVKNPESMTLDIMRLLRLTAHKEGVHTVEVRVAPSVAHHVLNRKRAAIHALEQETHRRLIIRADGNLGLDQYHFECLDARGGVVHTIEPPPVPRSPAEMRSKRNAPSPEPRDAFESVFD